MEDEEGTENKLVSKLLLNSDLFDPAGDESESDEELPGHTPSRSPTPPSLPAASSPPPRGRGRKASTAGRERKRSRVKKSEVQYIHRESQRLLRESSMSLPKYQPKTKTLDSFLTKLRSRGATAKSHTINKENEPLNQRASVGTGTVWTNPSPDPTPTETPGSSEAPPTGATELPLMDSVEPAGQCEEGDGGDPGEGDGGDPGKGDSGDPGEGDGGDPGEGDSGYPGKGDGVDPGEGHSGDSGEGDGSDPEGRASSTNRELEEAPDVPRPPPAVDGGPLSPGVAEDSSSVAMAGGIESAGQADQQRSECRDSSKPALNQTTLLGLFAARNKKLQQTTTEQPPPLTTPQPPPSPPPAPLPTPRPKLSSAVNFVLEGPDATAVEDPGQSRELTGVELLQQRFAMHAQGSEVRKEGEGPSKENGGVAPLVPGDVIAKLMDKPGAVRQHWRSALRQQLSQRRAEERREAEETRRLYSEDVSPLDEEEEEGELSDRDTTDAETSDEEYEQDEAAANADSDACSVLDEDEGGRDDGGGDEGGGGEADESGSESNDAFSDDDELYTVARPVRKPRLLESDDEESNDGGDPLRSAGSVTVGAKTVTLPASFEDTCSMSVFGDAPSAEDRARAGSGMVPEGLRTVAEGKRRGELGSLVELEEASMPPLVFSESFESEESSGTDSPSSLQRGEATEAEAAGKREAYPRCSESGGTNSNGSSACTDFPECSAVAESTQTAQEGKSSALPMDSGLGMSLGYPSQTQPVPENGSQTPPVPENGSQTQPVPENGSQTPLVPEEEPYTEPAPEGDSTSVGDNSLEMSFQWGASLPPAQPRRDPSLELFGSAVGRGERSREEETNRLPTQNIQDPFDSASQWDHAPSQSVSMDEETQFLDANGFLCLRKEKKPVSPVGGSSLKSIVDPSQEPNSDELLALCSGRFEETQNPTAGERERERDHSRNLSDSTSSQAVRELLGLPVRSPRQSSGIDRLLVSGSVPSEDTTQGSCMSEVLGLCSGVFPTTQPAAASTRRPPRASRSMQSAGTSDGMSSESEEGSGGEGAVLRWAQRQGRTGETGSLRVAPLPTPLGRYSSDSEDEDMPVLARRKRRSRPKPKPTKEERLAEFVESEAELSGEDEGLAGGEEEEEEPFSGPDEYEEEEGAGEDLPLSDSELWNQVNKAHMKHTLSDDKANLQDFKERFLRDGDLFEDGLQMKNGFFRTRHYAKADSEQGSVDLFAEERGEESDGEAEVAGSQAEALRRKDRLEREEFIKKCREREDSLMAFDEDSQSILDIIRDTTSHSLLNTPSVNKSDEPPRPVSTGCKRTRCGSFLKHNTATLRRLSSLTASTPSMSAPGKNFVFQKSDTHTPTHVKSSGGSKATPLAPVLKKPRLDRSSSLPSKSNSSIFSILK